LRALFRRNNRSANASGFFLFSCAGAEVKTICNKTTAGGRSISQKPSNSGKFGHKNPPRSKLRASTRAQLKNKPTIPRSSENPGIISAESNHAIAAAGQTRALFTSLDPSKVEEMIQDLSDLRVALAPQVRDTIPNGKFLDAIPGPLWKISGEDREDGKVLVIRHPGIGWLGFIIPHLDCKLLAEKLTNEI
jgi:hypothetical protein